MHTLEQLNSGELDGAKRFSMAAGLTEFPAALFRLADTLEVLDLCGNHLSTLPDDFGCFTQLKAVFFFNNQFDHIPKVLRDCPKLEVYGFRYNRITHLDMDALPDNLRWLILTGNRLAHIPQGWGRLQQLQKCMLAGNQLTSLPDDLQQCANLELLRISANQLAEFPRSLLSMPKLTWLAYAGNPFCQAMIPALPAIAPIHWRDVQLLDPLGQGASGVIYKAHWCSESNTTAVAVKMFRGDMTSDGSPMDERDATVMAGCHSHLVPLLGRLVGEPSGKQGLVFGLIPPQYHNMAGPPNLDTCTRDTYPKATRFSLDNLLNIVGAMVAVCEHLHSKGIMHGDFYPHNVLVTDTGETLVTDFGAACFYDTEDAELAAGLQALEVRALGCALDDMLRYCDANLSETAVFQSLQVLRDQCMAAPSLRPAFKAIQQQLQRLVSG